MVAGQPQQEEHSRLADQSVDLLLPAPLGQAQVDVTYSKRQTQTMAQGGGQPQPSPMAVQGLLL